MDGKAEIVAEACDHSAWSHCFSDDTLIIWYTLYRIYVSWCDGTDNKFRCKNVFYTLFLKSRDVDGPTTISCYFLYIYIYILHDTLYDLFRCFWCFLSVVVLCRCGIIISIIRWYSVRCLLLDIHVVVTGWCGASQVECAVEYIVLGSLSWMCSWRILFFFFFFNFSYLSFFFLLLLLLHIGIYTYIY